MTLRVYKLPKEEEEGEEGREVSREGWREGRKREREGGGEENEDREMEIRRSKCFWKHN